jgi:hypothetical protein
MLTTNSIPLNSLLIDTNNPRLEEMLENQLEAICAVAANQGPKLVVLAKDIVEHGLNPSESLIVTRVEGDPQHYVVLEGNRRVAALKVLKNPELISGAVEDSIVNRLKKLSAQYQDPIDELPCVIVDGRSEAYHWIELRHTGENEGAGIVRWGATETARFRRRSGQKSPHLQVLEFLEQRGGISRETRQKVPITSLKRLLSNPYVRTKLGVDVRSGAVLTRVADDSEVAKGLKRVVEDLASRAVRTKDIYLKDDRIRYIDTLPPEDLPDTSDLLLEFRRLGEPSVTDDQKRSRIARRSAPSRKARSHLIPRGFIVEINEPRVNEIYRELKKLHIEQYINAVSVLFRVFLELSLDAYIQREQLGTDERARLSKKLLDVANALKAQGKLTDQQIKPVRRAAQKDTFLASTITTMHQYVHNPYFFPAPSDLRATWDSLQPFVEELWS